MQGQVIQMFSQQLGQMMQQYQAQQQRVQMQAEAQKQVEMQMMRDRARAELMPPEMPDLNTGII